MRRKALDDGRDLFEVELESARRDDSVLERCVWPFVTSAVFSFGLDMTTVESSPQQMAALFLLTRGQHVEDAGVEELDRRAERAAHRHRTW